MKLRIGATDILLTAVSALFFVGMLTVFDACGPMEDGGWMTCHWAGNAVAGLACALTVIALIHLFAPNPKLKAGLAIAAIPVALLAVFVPGHAIDLCMMSSMRCRAMMRPATIVFSVLLVAVSAVDVAINLKKK